MEPLGGAASIISVVSLAIQVCDSIEKVHDVWQSFEDAPDDIAHIAAGDAFVLKWLAIIANNYQRQSFTSGGMDEERQSRHWSFVCRRY